MAEPSATFDAGFDLSQFHAVFYEEAAENLETMERLLLAIDLEVTDDEEFNAIFRCAHSVKGGAATFGFSDIAELTHEMETLLDRLRRRELSASPRMVDVLLEGGDALRALLDGHRSGQGAHAVDTKDLVREIRDMAEGRAASLAPRPGTGRAAPTASVPMATNEAATAAPAVAAAATAAEDEVLPPGMRLLELTVGPLDRPEQADDLRALFAEIPDLGVIEPLDGGLEADNHRRFKLITSSSDEDLIDLFCFHVDRSAVRLTPLGLGYGFHEGAPGDPTVESDGEGARPAAAGLPEIDGFGLFDDMPDTASAVDQPLEEPALQAVGGGSGNAEQASALHSEPVPATSAPQHAPPAGQGKEPETGADGASGSNRARARSAASTVTDGTLRVAVEKVDQLINLVGELVITQAVLTQKASELDPGRFQQFTTALADLERNTRNLQESVMSIRMIPMSTVFNRFPRMLRELAAKLGKSVEFQTHGETTELDKGMVEKITDPLTHLVRNSCDHGIEVPADRAAKGKPAHGTITLAASHQGGNVVIEVRDDGRGLNRSKLLSKARERGIDAPDSMSDNDVWHLIFAPGFSTADTITDVSGRGVGMDVVKKNIATLGGTVELDSVEGRGMTVRVRVPLTLAIMEGMLVRVAGECYVVPLASIVESFQPDAHRLKTALGGERLVRVRDDYLPVIDLQRLFHVPRGDAELHTEPLMVVLESDGRRVAAVVDELLGQQQVVVKNLESNYRRVDNVSGATILGDGSVSLILDVGTIVARACGSGPGSASLW